MNAHASALDIEKLAKIVSLMVRGATDGERAAARSRVASMAERAGMETSTALNILHSRLMMAGGAPFSWDSMMEAAEPGYLTGKAAAAAAKEEAHRTKCLEALERYGSEAAVFARCEMEVLLEAAVEHIATWAFWTDDTGLRHRYAERLDGQKQSFWWVDKITPATKAAVTMAYPWPTNLSEALAELKSWDRLRRDRELFLRSEWNHYAEVECRLSLLEDMLKNQPIAGWEDSAARFAWWHFDWAGQWINPDDNDYYDARPEIARLERDFEILHRLVGARRPKRTKPAAPRQPDLFANGIITEMELASVKLRGNNG